MRLKMKNELLNLNFKGKNINVKEKMKIINNSKLLQKILKWCKIILKYSL